MTVSPERIDILEGESFWLLGRPIGPQGETILYGDVSEVRCKVYNPLVADPTTPIWSKVLTLDASGVPTGCMHTAVLTDDMWTKDGDGYCFWQPMHPGDLDDSSNGLSLAGERTYRVEVEIDADAGTGSTYPDLDDMGTVVLLYLVVVGGRS